MATVFGLSLGNHQGVISVFKNGRSEVLANESGERETPMLVTYKDDTILVGSAAKGALYRNFQYTAIAMPSLLGTDLNENEEKKVSNITIIKKGGNICYKFEREGKPRLVPVKDTLGKVLEQLAATARSCESVSSGSIHCVLSVPIHYDTDHVSLLKQCVETHGFTVISTPPSPMLSVLPYGLDKDSYTGHVLVYDVGVNSISLTVIRLINGLMKLVGTRTINGVGGYDIDQELLSVLKDECKRYFRKDVTGGKYAVNKLLAAAESLKQSLTNQQTGPVYVESLHDGMDFQCNVTRGRFEGVCQSIFTSFLDPIQGFLNSLGLTGSNINKVILIGGTCKIPRLQQLMKDVFSSSEVYYFISTDHVVSLGAALEASYHQVTSGLSLSSTIPVTTNDLSLTFSNCVTPASVVLLGKHTPLPVCKTINTKIEVSEPGRPVIIAIKETAVLGELEVPPLASDENGNVLNFEVKFLWNSRDGSLNDPLLTVREVGSNWKSELLLSCKN
ncbi:PREDICTED: heat shock 70 kDa protein 14-like [Amphimedon queenslandica]|uniref:Uncharacterized protein n=1 Tax=Amphimedon queenslandica TaxID=400682 RepID=A0AAN0ICX5_AMPQE|nr:PREDICTED: heat shock 70 kDa protein 14-like [Amphimedon queenslandica]|eukprot:XP_003385322.2 PREDICTED: heat shock 70 kDa protein 14-like [Amphimedon queenslandica]